MTIIKLLLGVESVNFVDPLDILVIFNQNLLCNHFIYGLKFIRILEVFNHLFWVLGQLDVSNVNLSKLLYFLFKKAQQFVLEVNGEELEIEIDVETLSLLVCKDQLSAFFFNYNEAIVKIVKNEFVVYSRHFAFYIDFSNPWDKQMHDGVIKYRDHNNLNAVLYDFFCNLLRINKFWYNKVVV